MGNTVKQSIDKHQAKVVGAVSDFDRILLESRLPLGWAGVMESYIHSRKGLQHSVGNSKSERDNPYPNRARKEAV